MYDYVDVTTFRQALGSILIKEVSWKHTRSGHAWMVDTLQTHNLRLSTAHRIEADTPWPFAVPTVPDDPPGDPDSRARAAFKKQMSIYLQYDRLNDQCIYALEHRFIDCLIGEKTAFNSLPGDYTIYQALELVTERVSSETDLALASKKVSNRLRNTVYHPTAERPDVFYFNALLEDKLNLDAIGLQPVPYTALVVQAQMGIYASTVPKEITLELNQKWTTHKETMNQAKRTGKPLWVEFTKFYTTKFEHLYTDGALPANHGSANRLTEIEQLQRQVAQLKALVAASTTTSTTGYVAQTNPWRQWRFWCYSCGCNLKHDSTQCPRPKRDHKKEATFENPMGGNTGRNKLRLKWCHPVTNKIFDQPE